jgi:hypothetical protein
VRTATVFIVLLCLGLSVLSGCSSQKTNSTETRTSSAASWAFEFVVYNGYIYKISSDKVTNVGKEIGEVTNYSDKEGTYSGNFSNKYPVGTKYYAIQSVDSNKSIAIQLSDGSYVRADD